MALETPDHDKIHDSVKTLTVVDETAPGPHAPETPENRGELSSFKSICLVATCTAAMIINVSIFVLCPPIYSHSRITNNFRLPMRRLFPLHCQLSVETCIYLNTSCNGWFLLTRLARYVPHDYYP